ncbi:MAG: DUF4834 family protein [Prevotella sp.]|nr:DUF4834 family protein [Prevotella sp.]
MFILRFLFYVLLFGLLVVLFISLFVVLAIRKLHNNAKTTKQKTRGNQPRQATQADGNVIIDSRPAEEIGKKIIPKEEGEYVEYEDA